MKALQEDCHHSGSSLSYAWGKVQEHDALILLDPGSTHNFISTHLANKLGICDFEMGKVIKADGAFQGQEVLVTPLIGKLRLHIQPGDVVFFRGRDLLHQVPQWEQGERYLLVHFTHDALWKEAEVTCASSKAVGA